MGKMYYTVLVGLLLCLVVAVSGCTLPGSGAGNGTNVQGVTSVALTGPGTLIIEQGDNPSLTIEGDNTKVDVRVSGSNLFITNINSISNGAVKYRLTIKNLDSITGTGGGEIQATNLNTNKLSATIDTGKMSLSGKATDLVATINGAGTINAKELKTQTATMTINGAGTSTVDVTNTLNAIINGAGSISYLGNPQVNKQINGVGTVSQSS